MIGPFLNAFGILMGALFGLATRAPLSPRSQQFFKMALGAVTVLCGTRLLYANIHGTVTDCLKQLLIAALAAVLGNGLGKLLGLQKMSNRLGQYASKLLGAAQPASPGDARNGWVAVTILFCAAPLGIVGAVTDALSDYFYLLLIKAVMDGLAMTTFVKMFRWPVALAALPVFLFLDGVGMAVRLGAAPWLTAHGLTGYVHLAAGMVACSVALVIWEVRRVEMANYLPALVLAPLLAYWLTA
ncbi:MAG TPA: DUF554 family protein [Verrucomicrobiae bacterium]